MGELYLWILGGYQLSGLMVPIRGIRGVRLPSVAVLKGCPDEQPWPRPDHSKKRLQKGNIGRGDRLLVSCCPDTPNVIGELPHSLAEETGQTSVY